MAHYVRQCDVVATQTESHSNLRSLLSSFLPRWRAGGTVEQLADPKYIKRGTSRAVSIDDFHFGRLSKPSDWLLEIKDFVISSETMCDYTSFRCPRCHQLQHNTLTRCFKRQDADKKPHPGTPENTKDVDMDEPCFHCEKKEDAGHHSD